MVSFLLSATLVGRIRLDEPVPERSTGAAVWTSAAEGLRFALGNRFLRAITITAALSNLGANVVAAVYILYATRELGITLVGLGLVATALSVGTVLGAIVAGRVTARFGLGPTFLGAAALIVLGSAATVGALALVVSPIRMMRELPEAVAT